jgi:hypothetical protein
VTLERHRAPECFGQAFRIACDFEIAQMSQLRKLGSHALTAEIKLSR